ncbi:unnamed protein product [Rotaria sp. Silwood2]|nr:unnamed protein product [Rotaria sp. Silwood2]CAF4360429.1 unnamed protein product [Rotaria sp. Silwood2]
MEYSYIQLNDLPDEILMIIFKKLANVEVLYSLSGVNKRLNKIVHDSIFTNDLSFLMSTSNGLEKLPTLKSFWLHCNTKIFFYDELVVPLLHRMSNLEKLDLYINVGERKRFFDGNDLKMNIINHMPQLNKFTFNIHSLSSFYNEINLPSNEDIQKAFIDFKDKQIIYWTDYFPKQKKVIVIFIHIHIH